MKRYYWSIEDDAIISAQELDILRSRSAPEMSLAEYITASSYLNNGDLEPLTLEIERQKKALRSADRDADTIKAFIAELEELAHEEFGAE